MNQSVRSYDIIVSGGGTAGIAAALAAAETGAKTALLEKEYSLGGLATLGLVVIYLPLCDGKGTQMSGGLCEKLADISLKYGGAAGIPDKWVDRSGKPLNLPQNQRADQRYQITYSAPSFIIAAEELLCSAGVDIFYDTRLSGADVKDGKIESVYAETKRGRAEFRADAFVDSTGDADLCFFAGEPTEECDDNRRTGWYYSMGKDGLHLNGLSDPLYGDIPEGSRKYNGCDIDDISAHMRDMRQFIVSDIKRKRENGDPDVYPAIIPSFHGLRTTRKLSGGTQFSEDSDERFFYRDTIGMIGNWKYPGLRYSIPLRALEAGKISNLYAAGRCCRCDKSGWDLLRVIPSCTVTGQAAGCAAALCARYGRKPSYEELKPLLLKQGVNIDKNLFDRFED